LIDNLLGIDYCTDIAVKLLSPIFIEFKISYLVMSNTFPL